VFPFVSRVYARVLRGGFGSLGLRPAMCPIVTSGLNDSLFVLWVFPLLQNQTRVRAGDVIGEGLARGEAP
jgi:hypothetical protein